MKKTLIYLSVILSLLPIMAACGSKSTRHVDTTTLPIERIDLYLNELPPDVPLSVDTLQPGLNLYISMMGLDSALPDTSLILLSQSPVTKVFGSDIAERFTAADSLAPILGAMSSKLKSFAPDITISHVYGIASPYRQQVVVSDTIVLIALNHYLGADYPGYSSMPEYLRSGKVPGRIPLDVAEALLRVNFPYQPVTDNLLERMLYEGAIAQAVAEVCDINPMTVPLWSKGDIETLSHAEADIWRAYADGQLLYSTATTDITPLIEPTPRSRLGSMELPGQVGRFTGIKIVESYLKNNGNVDKSALLSPSFYGDPLTRLIESKYAF